MKSPCVTMPMKLSFFIFVAAVPAFGQNALVFNTTFDYPEGILPIEIIEDLNEAEGQVGEFSGSVPEGADGYGGSQLITIGNTSGKSIDSYLRADRATEDFTFSANFTDPVELDRAFIAFDIGTSRTSDDHAKDSEIVGFSSDGEEVFHLWISAKTTTDPNAEDELRLGYEGIDTDGIVWDLPAATGLIFGSDENGDIGFFNGNTDDPSVMLPSTFNLFFSPNGFSVEYVAGVDGGPEGGTLKLYNSGNLSYNGTGSNLARIEFRGKGGDNNDVRGGFWLDDLVARGTLVPEPILELEILEVGFDPVSRNGSIRFVSMPDVDYIVSVSNDLQNWTPINALQVRAGSEITAIERNIPEGVLKRFYQVEEAPEQTE